MLRYTRLFSVRDKHHDDIRSIYKGRNAEDIEEIEIVESQSKLIGWEPNGVLIYLYESVNMVTYITAYDIQSRECISAFSMLIFDDIVSASLNEDQSLFLLSVSKKAKLDLSLDELSLSSSSHADRNRYPFEEKKQPFEKSSSFTVDHDSQPCHLLAVPLPQIEGNYSPGYGSGSSSSESKHENDNIKNEQTSNRNNHHRCKVAFQVGSHDFIKLELSAKNSRFASKSVRRVQFLPRHRKGYERILVFTKTVIALFDFPSHKSKSNVYRLGNPILISLIADPFCWFELFLHKKLLYLVCPILRNKRDELKEYTLREVSLAAKKPNVVWEIPFPFLPPESVGFNCFFPLPYFINMNGPGVVHPHMRMIHFGKSLCLCLQHEIVNAHHNEPSIDISIYILHHKQQLNFTIPMKNIPDELILRTRVVFDYIDDLLMVLIPGYFLYIFDVDESRSCPCMNMIVNDPRVVTNFSSFTHGNFTKYGLRRSTNFVESEMKIQSPEQSKRTLACPFDLGIREHTLLDHDSGVVYEVTIERSFIVKMFDQDFIELKRPDIHLQLLHLACIHLQDGELTSEILNQILMSNPSNGRSGLFLEYLLASSAQSISSYQLPNRFERLLQYTTFDTNDVNQTRKYLENVSKTHLSGYTQISDYKIFDKDAPKDKLFSLLGTDKKPSVGSPPVSRYLRTILGFDEELFGPFPPTMKEDDFMIEDDCYSNCFALPLEKYSELLVDHWLTHFPDSARGRLTKWASSYRCIQSQQAYFLMKAILNTLYSKDDKYRLLQVLEDFFHAIRELKLPCPKDFHTIFCSLGFEFLPRSVFLQYVERRIFIVTNEFVENKLLKCTEIDPEFEFPLICRLASKDQIIPHLTRRKEYLKTVIEFFLFQNPSLLPHIHTCTKNCDCKWTEESIFRSGETYNGYGNSYFLPVTSFLQAMQGNGNETESLNESLWQCFLEFITGLRMT